MSFFERSASSLVFRILEAALSKQAVDTFSAKRLALNDASGSVSIPIAFMGHGAGPSVFLRQARLRAIECLNLTGRSKSVVWRWQGRLLISP